MAEQEEPKARKIDLRVKESTWEAYTRAAEALGIDRSTLIRQALEAGEPAMRRTYESMELLKAGHVLPALAGFRRLLGDALRAGRGAAADSAALEAEILAEQEKGAGDEGTSPQA